MINVDTVWAAGPLGAVLKTDDGGLTWGNGGGGQTISGAGIKAFSDSNVYEVGTEAGVNGEIWSGGMSGWTKVYTLSGSGLNALSAADADHIWAVGGGGHIVFGPSWTEQTSGVTDNLNGVCAVDTFVVWAVGDNGVILKTTDGGGHWVKQPAGYNGGVATNLLDIAAVDEMTAWAVGEQGLILHTTNGGLIWKAQISGTEARLTGVAAVDANYAWAAGEDGTILHTTDGGGARFYVPGDLNGDGLDEMVVGFGSAGLWCWSGGAWILMTTTAAESGIAVNLDGDGDDELAVDFGPLGLWLWNNGAWVQMTSSNPEFMTSADLDGTGGPELVIDFGTLGLWAWGQGFGFQWILSNPESVCPANIDGDPASELVVDYGALGLFSWDGGVWTQLLCYDAQHIAAADSDGDGVDEIWASFTGRWGYWLWDSGDLINLGGSIVYIEKVVSCQVDTDISDEVLNKIVYWSYNWGMISVYNDGTVIPLSTVQYGAEEMIAADVDGDNFDEVIWGQSKVYIPPPVGKFIVSPTTVFWDGPGSSSIINHVKPMEMAAANIDADAAEEVFFDYGPLGIWIYDQGVWTNIWWI